MRGVRRWRHLVVSLLCASMLPCGCKVQDDAVAAADQITTTAADLRLYYGRLAATVAETIELYAVDAAVSGVPFSAEDRKPIEGTRDELLKRKAMAESLAKLAESLTKLTKSTASDDVETSATALGNELVSAGALSSTSPVPAALGQAGRVLLQLVEQHDEKRAALAMDGTLAAVAELFEKERPVYDSLERTHLGEASQVAKDLLAANEVDVASLLRPALRPFGLTPLPATPQLQESLRALASARLQARAEGETSQEAAAAAAMLAALREMSARVHSLAAEKRMPLRGKPFSLTVVESWAAAAI